MPSDEAEPAMLITNNCWLEYSWPGLQMFRILLLLFVL